MRKKLLIIASLVLAFAGLVALTPTQQTGATEVENENKITICHRTDSVTNPYEQIEVDEDAVDGESEGDHFLEHTGPLASSQAVAQALKDDKVEWGDIIPPIAGVHGGLNWTALGQAMYNNDCNYVTVVTPAAVIFKAPTCDALGSYTIPTTEGVKYMVDGVEKAAGEYTAANGTSVTVTAVAASSSFFLEGTTEWSYTFTAPTSCGSVLGTTTTSSPTSLPLTSGDSTIATVTVLSMLTGVVTFLGFAARSILARRF